MAKLADDRRKHPRVRLDGRTAGRVTVLADFRVLSMSESGALLAMQAPLALQSQCDLSLSLSHLSVDVQGHVVNVEAPGAPEEPYRVAVQFVNVEALDRGLLLSFLDRERQREGV
jgi:hypothetical protein